MTYHDLSSCTLSDDERLAEKDEILDLIFDIAGTYLDDKFSHTELVFLMSMTNTASVSVKQLFWLRDLKEKIL